MSMFDPNAFADMQFTEANSTSSTPCPAGEYTSVVKDFKLRPWTSKDQTKAGLALDVFWSVDDANVKAALERDEVVVKQGIMLDMTEDGSGLDMGKGKNVGLGRLREALGLNTPGQPFAFSMMNGRPAKVVVVHRSDDKDSSIIYAEVKAVAKLA